VFLVNILRRFQPSLTNVHVVSGGRLVRDALIGVQRRKLSKTVGSVLDIHKKHKNQVALGFEPPIFGLPVHCSPYWDIEVPFKWTEYCNWYRQSKNHATRLATIHNIVLLLPSRTLVTSVPHWIFSSKPTILIHEQAASSWVRLHRWKLSLRE
jgi:hypothetical protein